MARRRKIAMETSIEYHIGGAFGCILLAVFIVYMIS